MNATTADGAVTPLYFPSGGETLFGWLHRPAGKSRPNLGLVICKPFGYDAICAHRSLRVFAARSAAIGVPVLRFDYSGTGDSSDGQPEADQIEQWTADIVAAVAALRQHGGVERICLLGVRLGALLAMLAAAKSDAAQTLIAIAPVVSGRRYLRELRTFQATAVENTPAFVENGQFEVTGFELSAASVQTLANTDLMRITGCPVRDLLILDRSELPGAKPWADTMLGLGSNIGYEQLPGFPEMMSTPHAAQAPERMIEAAVTWLGRLPYGQRTDAPVADAATAAETAATPEARFSAAAQMTAMTMAAEGGRVSEQALYIDAEAALFAILTTGNDRPAAAADPSIGRPGVVLLNAGATYHIGPNRMYVSLARRWAARGYVVLRLDLAGLGDSDTRPSRPENEVYPPDAIDDVASAIEYLRLRHGVADITLVGLCAGAYHALRSASAGLPVNRALMINPLTFFWKPGMTLSDLQIAEIVRNPGIYRERVFSRGAWLRLLRGHVNLWRVALIFARRAWLSFDTNLRNFLRRLRIRLPDDLGWDLQSIAARGVRMVFVFARGDTGADLLRIQGGRVVAAIGDRCRVYTVDGADHIFSQSAPRERLEQLLGSELPI